MDLSSVSETKAELDFIDALGTFSQAHRKSRTELLHGYINGCFRRTHWGGISKTQVLKHARESRSREMGGAA